MGNPVVPTYHNATHGMLKSPTDVALYLIRWTFANPGETSSQHEDEMVSFRQLEALYGKTPEDLTRELQIRLQAAIDHYFPDKYEAVVNYDMAEDGSGKYSISIDFSDKGTGQAICRRHLIEVDVEGAFTVKAEGDLVR